MPQPLRAEFTPFTLDTMGRFLANTLQEAIDSSHQTIGESRRDFDVIVVGRGSFGSVLDERLFLTDRPHSYRVLVLEAGPFVLPEHTQNLPFMGGEPDMVRPWVADTAQWLAGHKALNYKGLIYAVGGRSLSWGGWSPQLLDAEVRGWPNSVVGELRSQYFQEASDQIGVDETNDFIYGRLHVGLRKQIHEGLTSSGAKIGAVPFALLPDHPVIQYSNPAQLTDDVLRNWLGLPVGDTTPRAQLLELFKLEAPLAVQSQTLPGLFPFNKFSAVPVLIRAARLAETETDGTGPAADARKRLPPSDSNALQASALFVKGQTMVDGQERHFHLQITASGISTLGVDSEAELFKKIPDIEHVGAMLRADDKHVVVTLRGIGEMSPRNPDSKVELAKFDTESGRPAAYVEIGDAGSLSGGSHETNIDRQVWEAMDAFTDQIAVMLTSGEPFEILGKTGEVTIAMPARATADDIAREFPHTRRHDALGTTHHDAGTLWMGTDPAISVTNEYGRIHR